MENRAQRPNMKLVPVYNAKGEHELFDIYIGKEWIGSRRTIEQCKLAVENARKSP
jgi:hypothetical protein